MEDQNSSSNDHHQGSTSSLSLSDEGRNRDGVQEETLNQEQQQQEEVLATHDEQSLEDPDEELRERMKRYIESRGENKEGGSQSLRSDDDDSYNHEEEFSTIIASPSRRNHLTTKMMSPLGIKKSHQKVFLEMFHQTLPESIHTVDEREKKETMAATILQKAVKGFLVRRKYMKRRVEEAKNKAEYEANQIELSDLRKKRQEMTNQSEMKEHSQKIVNSIQASIKRIKHGEQTRQESAAIIQRAWRRYKEKNPNSEKQIQEASTKLISQMENSEYFGERMTIENLMVLLSNSTQMVNPYIARPDYSYKMSLV
ncbi:hypothetical protein FDP41_011727 [Naegleria fowleri]|uniref:Uncharacterized protein n=1 Tax=Naegleria fowleri TaxID=5763 RepID=A0A6A5C2F1_NAEFO|nr:uncharacterized protein FDP41_011727 [Naegleria fowleri]KAF0981866.1 hypothetical protein FDP41_011727 [Naegleria fowleri]